MQEASANKKVNDFEDGLQYYAALHSGCKVIVTENRDDFYFSDRIDILTTYDFLKKHVVRNDW